MSFLLAASVLASFTPQSSIERVYVQTASKDAVREVNGVTLSDGDFGAYGSSILMVEGGEPGRSEMIRARGTGFMDCSYELRFTAPVATTYSWSFRAPFSSCGSSCDWGPSDFGTFANGGGGPLTAGQTVAVVDTGFFPASMGFDLDESDLTSWPFAQNGFSYYHGVDCFVDWQSQEPVRVETFRVAARSSMTIETTYRLFDVPSAQYCTSQANSTGQTASIAAFGVPKAGSEQFALQVDGTAPGVAGLLFMADNFGLNVGSTTTLCLGGGIRRVGGLQFEVGGEMVFGVDLTGWPAGETAYFQAFFRDPQFGLSASEAISVLIQ